MRTLLMTIGLPRSGKSTWARKQGHPIVCPDAIRMALYGQPYIRTAEAIVWANAKLMVASLFEAGHEVVILDATNTVARYRDEWIDDRWECKYIVFSTPRGECVRRAIACDQEYLLPVIERMADGFESPEVWYSPQNFVGGFLKTELLNKLESEG